MCTLSESFVPEHSPPPIAHQNRNMNFRINTIRPPLVGAGVVNEIGNESIRLQLDLFHLQFLEGDLTNNIKKYLPITGTMTFFVPYSLEKKESHIVPCFQATSR